MIRFAFTLPFLIYRIFYIGKQFYADRGHPEEEDSKVRS